MVDEQRSQIRIGDTERESALAALGEHMSAGRLDIDEYGDRSARVPMAKTWGELTELFSDLPNPHPAFGTPKPPPMPAQQVSVVPPAPGVPFRQRAMAAAVPLAGLVALGLFLTIHFWIVFLLPAVVVIFGGAIFGDDWKHQRRLSRERYRQERREIRRRGRDW
ncbi:MAG TPA: DUF1707 domain-containing protein [Mycobacteriales bacterium]|nr:DUF1707 domain-containing protein [Mycobacteriales bacterium]